MSAESGAGSGEVLESRNVTVAIANGTRPSASTIATPVPIPRGREPRGEAIHHSTRSAPRRPSMREQAKVEKDGGPGEQDRVLEQVRGAFA